jgi:O-antigen/teichoic acid export membrane protein
MTRNASIARNTLWNLAGTALPLVVAVFAIPVLIRELGTERFGVLMLAWAVMGHFALFDFGLGLATTKFVAECLARQALADLPRLVWASLTAHVVLGLAGGALLALLTPWLTERFFSIPPGLLVEVRTAFYLLALSVPLVVVTASLRGMLEGMHRFDLVNYIRVPAGAVNYLIPIIVVFHTKDLAAVVAAILAVRAVVLVAHVLVGLGQLPVRLGPYGFTAAVLRPLVGFGGWVTVSSLVSPSIVFIDRFAIGALVSMSAVAYYATPYEAVTKLWMFSASLLAALFPVLSALSVVPGAEIRALHGRAMRYLLVTVAPIVGLLLAFADDLLTVWISAEFAHESAPATRWLALGVLINVLAQIPYTVLQGMGHAGVVARVQLALLPCYVAAIWMLITAFGVTGAAMAWAGRAAVELVLLAAAAERRMPAAGAAPADSLWRAAVLPAVILVLLWTCGTMLAGTPMLKLAAAVGLLALLVAWEWGFVLDAADRSFVSGAARRARELAGR